jgi:hypothetical protein
METPFNSKELQNAEEKISSPTYQHEARIKKEDLLKLFEKFSLQQSHSAYRALQKGYSLSKKSSNNELLKNLNLSIESYLVDNLPDEEKKASNKKINLYFNALEKIVDIMVHDYNKSFDHNLIYFLLGNLLKNIHE